jgi:hypothetical protein
MFVTLMNLGALVVSVLGAVAVLYGFVALRGAFTKAGKAQ